jgi:hypothetical protein
MTNNCPACKRPLRLDVYAKIVPDGSESGHLAWFLGRYCSRCREWAERSTETWATVPEAEQALEARK